MKVCQVYGLLGVLTVTAVVRLGFAQEGTKQPAKGIDPKTIAAYEMVGGAYGGWTDNFSGIRVGEKFAEEGVPGFIFEKGAFPKTKLPPVSVPFALDLGKTDISDATIKGLAQLTNLTSLNLSETKITDAGLKELAGLKNLTKLSLSLVPVTDDGLKELAPLQNLTELSVGGTLITDEGLKYLASLRNLTTLWLESTAISDAKFKDLAPLQKLELLYVSPTVVTDRSLRDLREAKLLHTAGFAHGKDKVHSRPKSPADVTEAWLIGASVTGAGLNELRDFKNLQCLGLMSSTVTDDDLKQLVQFKDLDTLYLNDTKLTDAGLKELANLKRLTRLDLANTALTGAGLRELARFKNLTVLNLNGVRIQTGTDIEELEKALPNCKIILPFRIRK